MKSWGASADKASTLIFLERENSAFLSSTIYVNPSRIMEVYTTNFSGIFFYLQRASRDFDETLPL